MKISIKLFAVLSLLSGNGPRAAPPDVYRQSAYESPTRGAPDDLLLIAGYGFAADNEVIYRAVLDTTTAPVVPTQLPSQSTAEFGRATVVSTADVPYSLTVKLPQALRADQSYALWVRTVAGEWSKAMLINDARPFWISPSYVYSTGSIASLPREVKVVGRNLAAEIGQVTQIRLTGPETYTANAIADRDSSATMRRYVARLRLPEGMRPGHYHVALSRDGVSWVALPGQLLEVQRNPPARREYPISDTQYGGCAPNDDVDDTACLLRAIAAAKHDGGGVVVLGPGIWDLVDGAQSGVASYGGIIVPDGVALLGAGASLTTLQRHRDWTALSTTAALTLVGHNIVTGFTFLDLQRYAPGDRAGPFIQLGEDYRVVAARASQDKPATVADGIIITANVFDRTITAIQDGGLPISNLFITDNVFGAYSSALELGGNRFNTTYKYHIDDAVIDFNTFKPGSKLDLREKTGTIATEVGAGHRVDFSGNTADGNSKDFLYSAADPPGWRAGFFWNLNDSVEETLISQNTATCTGDKIGDGEAFAFDNNDNTFAFPAAAIVEGATSDSVAVSAPLAVRQNDRDINADTYYIGHWVQVASGPGLAQVRRIVGYTTDPESHLTRFKVAPDWDVRPVAGLTRIAIGREFWQVYALENRIDHRQPLCQKSNRSRKDGGAITLWAQSADSVIEGNLQYDTDGILVQQAYMVPEHPCPQCTMSSFFQSFLDVRGNTIDGGYAWDTDCSSSGIIIAAAASPWNDAVPPTVGFGVTVAHNIISHAEAPRGGAIAQVDSWYAGPEPHRWPLSDNLLVYHNSIEDIDGARTFATCGKSHARIGINFPTPAIAWRTVLYANSCARVSVPVAGEGVDTVRVCPSTVASESSCECR